MKWQHSAAALAIVLAAVVTVQAGQFLPQKSILSGKVVGIPLLGAIVREGQILATIETLAGTVPAVRASADGVIKEVKVSEGQNIEQGTVIAVLETK